MRHLSRHWKTKELVEAKGIKSRPHTIYKPNQKKPYKISRSGVETFMDCRRCFYLNVVKGLKDIDSIPFTLNNTVDEQVKTEFDYCREKQIPHEVMTENKLDAIPFQHEKIDDWRNARSKGVEYHHEEHNLILSGGIDDVWTVRNSDPPELIIVDYKAQAKKQEYLNLKSYLDDPYHQSYKFQLNFYRYLFKKLNFKVHSVGYFLVYNAKQERQKFGKNMEFQRFLVPYKFKGDSINEIEKTIKDMKKDMDGKKIPPENKSCQECASIREGSKLINS